MNDSFTVYYENIKISALVHFFRAYLILQSLLLIVLIYLNGSTTGWAPYIVWFLAFIAIIAYTCANAYQFNKGIHENTIVRLEVRGSTFEFCFEGINYQFDLEDIVSVDVFSVDASQDGYPCIVINFKDQFYFMVLHMAENFESLWFLLQSNGLIFEDFKEYELDCFGRKETPFYEDKEYIRYEPNVCQTVKFINGNLVGIGTDGVRY